MSGPLSAGIIGDILTNWKRATETGLVGWGGRIRTSEWRNQNPLPYHLATPQIRIAAGGSPTARRTITARPPGINDDPGYRRQYRAL